MWVKPDPESVESEAKFATGRFIVFSNALPKVNQHTIAHYKTLTFRWPSYTNANWTATAELSQPASGLPQVTTDQPGSRQTRISLLESAEQPWAGFWPRSCHHQHLPSHNWPILQDCSKGAISCLNLLALSWSWTWELLPPWSRDPHVISLHLQGKTMRTLLLPLALPPLQQPGSLLFNLGSLQRLRRIHHSTSARSLKLPIFGGLQEPKCLTAAAWQS